MTFVAGVTDATGPALLDGEAMDRGEASFAASVREVFSKEIFGKIFRHAVVSLDEAQDLVDELRTKLTVLGMTLEEMAGSADAPAASETKPAAIAAAPPQAKPNGAAPGAVPATGAPTTCQSMSKLTSRQKSRVRELALLQTLNRTGEAGNGPALYKAINDLGVAETTTQGAMVSQLHRMAEQEYVTAHGNGMYEITSAGLQRERDLRKTYGAYLKAG